MIVLSIGFTQEKTKDITQDKPVNIAEQIENFEYQFSNLHEKILLEIVANNKINTVKILNTLTLLPMQLRKEYEKAIKELLPTLSHLESINELFYHLNPLLSFLDYGLLEYIIKRFGSYETKEDMKAYCNDMQVFMKETTVQQLIDHLPGQQEAPPNFSILKAKIGDDAKTCTLAKIDSLRKRLCAEIRLSEIIFRLIALEESNSFIISWLVPSVSVPDLIKSALKIQENLFQAENIASLSVGNRWLYNPKLIPFGSKLRRQYQLYQGSPSPFEWIPSPTKKIFRLAMIQRERVQQGHIEDRFVQMTIGGRVDDILRTKSPIELKQIFKRTLHGSEIILIEGAPGSGKSTLTVHICQRWGNGELFQQFAVVILVQLRDPAVQRAQTVADMLPIENLPYAQELSTEIIATNGRGVLWVLDGWDELPTHLQQDSIFCTLIQRMLHECSVVVTSRPISSADLHPMVSSRIEVLGFTPEEQRQYFTECLKGDTKALEALLEKIQENPVVQSICYLPLNAAFVVHSFKLKGQLLANTVYEIYSTVILSCIQRHFHREGRGHELPLNIDTLHDLSISEAVREPFQHLCELAYRGVMENKVTFSCSDLPQGSNTLSLLQAIESFLQSGKSVLYNFLHLSIQEVFSAYYIATRLSGSEQVSQFQELFNQPRFTAVFQFYSAITKLKSSEIHQVIDQIVEAKSKPLLVSLLHCLHEAQDPSLCHYVAKKLKYKLDISDISLSPLDYLSVGFFLSSDIGREIGVDLRHSCIGDLGARGLTKYLSSEVDYVSKVAIYLDGSQSYEEEAVHIAGMLLFTEHMYLSRNPIGVIGASLISEAIIGTVVLKTLILSECGITSKGAEDVSRALAKNISLEKFDISSNNLGDDGISYLAEALKQNTQLKELWIGQCEMSNKGAASLASALSVNKSLKMLHMGGLKGLLTKDGLSTIGLSLANNSEFDKLTIPYQFDPATLRTWKFKIARKKNGFPLVEVEGKSL